MYSVVYIIFLLVFLFTDAWYFIRVIWLFLCVSLRRSSVSPTKNDVYKAKKLNGIVLPSDLDLNMHMNNSKYLRECDFGRIHFWLTTGLNKVCTRLKARIVVNAVNIRYRRSLELFQSFELLTKLICWEDDAFYLEQSLVTGDGFIAAIAYVKVAVRGVTAPKLMATLFGEETLTSCPLPPEILTWKESISISSQKLRQNNN